MIGPCGALTPAAGPLPRPGPRGPLRCPAHSPVCSRTDASLHVPGPSIACLHCGSPRTRLPFAEAPPARAREDGGSQRQKTRRDSAASREVPGAQTRSNAQIPVAPRTSPELPFAGARAGPELGTGAPLGAYYNSRDALRPGPVLLPPSHSFFPGLRPRCLETARVGVQDRPTASLAATRQAEDGPPAPVILRAICLAGSEPVVRGAAFPGGPSFGADAVARQFNSPAAADRAGRDGPDRAHQETR